MDELVFDGVMFAKFKNWLVVISRNRDIVHVFTSTDERYLKSMVLALIKKQRALKPQT
jgi:hypothetical protein